MEAGEVIAQANAPLDEKSRFINQLVNSPHLRRPDPGAQ